MLLSNKSLQKVDLMAIGSSAALFQLKSDAIVPAINLPYYNFSAWSLQMADTKLLLQHFVEKYHPSYVIVGSSIADFKRDRDSKFANYLNAGAFVQNHFQQFFYVKNDNSLYRIFYRKLWDYHHTFDNWGQEITDFKTDTTWIKYWKLADDPFPTRYTASNYEALAAMGAYLQGLRIKFIFIQFPVAEEYAKTNIGGEALKAHFSRCQALVEHYHGVYLSYQDTIIFSNIMFHDRYHLTNSGDDLISRKIATDLKNIIGKR